MELWLTRSVHVRLDELFICLISIFAVFVEKHVASALFLQVIAVNSFGSAQFCLCSRHTAYAACVRCFPLFESELASCKFCVGAVSKKKCLNRFGKAGIADGRVLIPLQCSGCSAATAAYLVPCYDMT